VQFSLPPLTPWVRTLVLALGGAFVLQAVLESAIGVPLFGLLALDPQPATPLVWVWQVLAYPFVWPMGNGGVVLWAAISIFVVYLVLAGVELRFGLRRTAELGAGAVLGGAVPVLLLGALWPAGWLAARPIYGAHPLVLAAIAAFAMTVRGGQVYLFPLPIALKSWHLLGLVIGYSALVALIERNPFGLASDLGAIGAGVAYAAWLTRPRSRPKPKAKKARRNGDGSHLRVVEGGRQDDDGPRWLN
jgi:hypothetical protein